MKFTSKISDSDFLSRNFFDRAAEVFEHHESEPPLLPGDHFQSKLNEALSGIIESRVRTIVDGGSKNGAASKPLAASGTSSLDQIIGFSLLNTKVQQLLSYRATNFEGRSTTEGAKTEFTQARKLVQYIAREELDPDREKLLRQALELRLIAADHYYRSAYDLCRALGFKADLEDPEAQEPTLSHPIPRPHSAPESSLRLDAFQNVVDNQTWNQSKYRLDLNQEAQELNTLVVTNSILYPTYWIEETVKERYPIVLNELLDRLVMFERRFKTFLRVSRQRRVRKPVYQRVAEGEGAMQWIVPDDPRQPLTEIVLKPIQVENRSNLELIVSFTRPLRFEALRRTRPRLVLYRDNSPLEQEYLQFDEQLSSDTMLVFALPSPRLSAGLLAEGEYLPKLRLAREHLPLVGDQTTEFGFSFSAATERFTRGGEEDRRPNIQLIAGLRQDGIYDPKKDPDKAEESAFRGVIQPDRFEAIIEVQVNAGAPVKGAKVTGTLQRVDDFGQDDIISGAIVFKDDGNQPDQVKDDGIYTYIHPLGLPRRGAEYRVFIEAKATDTTAFARISENLTSLTTEEVEKARKEGKVPAGLLPTTPEADEARKPKVPRFQRATSLNFRVNGAQPDAGGP